MIWRTMLVVLLLGVGLLGAAYPTGAIQERDTPADLAAMPVLPQDLPEPGFQLGRGGYLSQHDAAYLITTVYDVETDAIKTALETASWRQGYTQALVLPEDRAYRTSTPLATVETTILEFADEEGAELVEAMMTGTVAEGAELLDVPVENATTFRIVTSQDDRLVTVVRSGPIVFGIVSADATGRPDPAQHFDLVRAALVRAERVTQGDLYGLSQHVVALEDPRLIPLAIETEVPLVHTFYRVLDDRVISVAGELYDPDVDEVADGVEEVVIARQTAELASQSWLTAGVVVSDFGDVPSANDFAEVGLVRDPLDVFAVDEDAVAVDSLTGGMRIESLSGETRAGGRFSGYRVTVRDDTTVAQLTVRVTGNARLDQREVEMWAHAQRECLAGSTCDPFALTDLLAISDPATPLVTRDGTVVYTSPVAAWRVTFDSDVWRIEETLAEGGYDYLYLRSERMNATFETVVDHHGDPKACVVDELDRLREVEDGASIILGSDEPDASPGGLGPGHGWVIYTVEPLEVSRAATEYTVRIDCYTVLAGSTSLVVQTRAPRDVWADESTLGEELRSQIEIDGLQGGRIIDASVPGTHKQGRVVMDTRRPWTGVAA